MCEQASLCHERGPFFPCLCGVLRAYKSLVSCAWVGPKLLGASVRAGLNLLSTSDDYRQMALC